MDAEQDVDDLVVDAQNGDDSAFTELVQIFKKQVLCSASRYANTAQDCDDLAQDVFIKCYRKLHTYRFESPFGHWLAKITTRTCYDFIRKKRSLKEQMLVPVDPDLIGRVGAADAQPVGDRDAEALAGLADAVHEAISRLKPDERLVLTEIELEGGSIESVSALTGWSNGNVRVRLHRAKKKLKRILQLDEKRS